MNNQTLFQIVQAAGGMHLLYNNDIEQVRAIASAAFEAGKQAAAVQDVLDMSDSRNWQAGDVVRSNDSGLDYTVIANHYDAVHFFGSRVPHATASANYFWISRATKETAK